MGLLHAHRKHMQHVIVENKISIYLSIRTSTMNHEFCTICYCSICRILLHIKPQFYLLVECIRETWHQYNSYCHNTSQQQYVLIQNVTQRQYTLVAGRLPFLQHTAVFYAEYKVGIVNFWKRETDIFAVFRLSQSRQLLEPRCTRTVYGSREPTVVGQ